MKHFKISSEFVELKEFILTLPDTFDSIGLTIVKNRNVVKKTDSIQGTVIVKSFKGMYFFNQLAYSIFKKSKAERSYINSEILKEKGFTTPPNVGWLDCYTGGLLTQSYYISTYSPYKTLRQVLQNNLNDKPFRESIYNHLVTFIIKLHHSGVLHNDFSLTNILVIPTNDGYQFSLVDLNRIRFQKVSFREGLRNFHKLEIPKDEIEKLIRDYAVRENKAPDAAVDVFWADTKRTLFLRGLRKKLRKYTLTPLEDFKKQINCPAS